jgi:hypothetical protein
MHISFILQDQHGQGSPSHTIMSDETQTLGQNSNKFLINQSRDSNTVECAICGYYSTKDSRLAFLDEFLS